MDATDRALVERAAGGSREALDEIARRWDRPIVDLAYRLTGKLEEALDIRQIALVRAFRGLAAFDGEARFSTWLYRIVVNVSRDLARSRRSRRDALLGRLERGSPAPAGRPDQESSRRERARLVAGAVDGLPAEEREVVALRHWRGCTFAEIAEIVGAPTSTVKARMDRGLRRLRARLRPLAGEMDGGVDDGLHGRAS